MTTTTTTSSAAPATTPARTVRRLLAASAAIAGTGAAVVALPAEPAGAHDTHLEHRQATGAVGAGHAGLRVCNEEAGTVAQIRYYSPGQSGDPKVIGAVAGQCYSYVDPEGVARWRLCVWPGHGCTGWKEA